MLWASISLIGCGQIVCLAEISNKPYNDLLKEEIEKAKETLKLYPAGDMSLHMDIEFDNQCNLEFSTEELKELADLGVTFSLSCYQDKYPR